MLAVSVPFSLHRVLFSVSPLACSLTFEYCSCCGFSFPADNVFLLPQRAAYLFLSDSRQGLRWRNPWVGSPQDSASAGGSCPVLRAWEAGRPVGLFPNQQPHGSQKERSVQAGAVTAAGRGEAGTRVLCERFDTRSHSPLSLVLVSKQCSSPNCSLACSLLSHMLLVSH